MKLTIEKEVITKLIKAGCKNPAILDQKDEYWHISIESKFLTPADIDKLREIVSKDDSSESRKLLRKLNVLNKARKAADKPVVKLELLSEMLIAVVRKLPNKRVYMDDRAGNQLPYYIGNITFHERDHRDNPAHISIELYAHTRGQQESEKKYVHREDLGNGVTAEGLLADVLGWSVETNDLNAAWEKEIETYRQYFPQTGRQFLGTGEVETMHKERRWRTNTVRLGAESKIIMDDLEEREDKKSSLIIEASFWAETHDDKKEERNITALPIHPYVRAFDLRTHQFICVHVNQIEPYVYDTKIADKLVLSDIKRWMIDTLVNVIGEEGGDIIAGKSGGIVVLSSGAPGTGKTLTAEVYAEASRKALYVVQCSQLGIDPDTLEKELGIVLERAQRWGVVLLIDEADVYIHERGANMTQNAVVGIFLRLLEYYSGILFLTTNRETLVDDAIISRVTAHVKYDLPEADERRALWKILASQYKLDMPHDLRDSLVDEFPAISGRTIMKLVRLVKVMSTKLKAEPTVAMFREASLFQKMEQRRRTT